MPLLCPPSRPLPSPPHPPPTHHHHRAVESDCFSASRRSRTRCWVHRPPGERPGRRRGLLCEPTPRALSPGLCSAATPPLAPGHRLPVAIDQISPTDKQPHFSVCVQAGLGGKRVESTVIQIPPPTPSPRRAMDLCRAVSLVQVPNLPLADEPLYKTGKEAKGHSAQGRLVGLNANYSMLIPSCRLLGRSFGLFRVKHWIKGSYSKLTELRTTWS